MSIDKPSFIINHPYYTLVIHFFVNFFLLFFQPLPFANKLYNNTIDQFISGFFPQEGEGLSYPMFLFRQELSVRVLVLFILNLILVLVFYTRFQIKKFYTFTYTVIFLLLLIYLFYSIQFIRQP
jgi:hypothetical protein